MESFYDKWLLFCGLFNSAVPAKILFSTEWNKRNTISELLKNGNEGSDNAYFCILFHMLIEAMKVIVFWVRIKPNSIHNMNQQLISLAKILSLYVYLLIIIIVQHMKNYCLTPLKERKRCPI
jgi:hypothetical protein